MLQFSDTSDAKNGLIQECEFLLFNKYGVITDDDELLATFTRGINDGMNRVVSLILQADGRWQFDDTNDTDLPIGSTSLVSGQQDYTFDIDHLKVLRVEVKNSAGSWRLLLPIDQADVYDQSLTDFLNTSGTPQYYDKIANSIFLYPKPNYSQTLSLKVYFQRPPSYFIITDTTKTPGFNSLYHKLPALIASRDYAIANTISSAQNIVVLITQMEADLQQNYSMRNKDERNPRLTARTYSFR